MTSTITLRIPPQNVRFTLRSLGIQAKEDPFIWDFTSGIRAWSDTEVQSCSKNYVKTYEKLQKQFDEQRQTLSKANLEIIAYQLGLESVEAQLVVHQKNEVVYEEKIAVLEFEVKDKSNVVTRLKNYQLSSKDKTGLGYGDQLNENDSSGSELFNSVFDSHSSDGDDNQTNDKFKKDNGYHVVPPPLTGNYMPPLADLSFAGLDDSVYRPTANKTSASVSQVEANITPPSNASVEMPRVESVRPNKPSLKRIEFTNARNESVKPKQADKPRIITQNPKVDRRYWNGKMTQKLGLGFGFTKKACFVCGSYSHLIKDYDFHEKRMAKKSVLKNMGKNSSQREIRPVWNSAQRINHQNKFVPSAVLTRFRRVPVSTAKQSSLRATASTSTFRPVNTGTHTNRVNVSKLKTNAFHKSHSPIRRPFYKSTASNTRISNEKVNTVRVNGVNTAGQTAVSTVKGTGVTVVKASGNPQQALKNKGIFDSGCSRHMTGNKDFLIDYQDIDGGCQFLGSRLISWQCKKQTVMANSTTEDEYIAASHCCSQVLWIQNQMLDYRYNFMQTKIHVDNESAICVVKNPVYHSKTKHIEIRHHFIRDSYEKRLIEMVTIHTNNNVADLLTKTFDVNRFNFLVASIYMDPHEFSHVYLVISSVLVMNRYCLLPLILLVHNQASEDEGLATPPEPPNPHPLLHNQIFHEPQTEAHIKQLLPSPTTYQRKRKTQTRRKTTKDTKLPQTSVPQDLGADEAVHKEGVTVWKGLSLLWQSQAPRNHGGTPAQTRSERVLEKPNEPPLSEGHTSGSGKGRMEHQFELTANVPITPHDSPLPGGYTPGSDEGPDREVDDSMFTYGPKQSKTSESDTQTSNYDSCESNSSTETLESVPEPVIVEPYVVSQPKVCPDAPIIEEYESDSDDEYVIQPSKEQKRPSFAFIDTVKHVKTPKETVK
ncbi:hypothetical protein Tco_0991915 [Tanacetum coccineum]|uniref:Uncharacterized protein n=1 Tax=Tanacetum coccineum TaxID=301880 RepID=A0ABQ5F0J6_9ASTR